MSGSAHIIRGNALDLPLEDASVDLICTSPPYFGLRSYQDGCKTCSDSSKAHMRGYMERYCPGCNKVGTVQKCPKCDLTTLRTEATKAAIRKTPVDPDCPECKGTGTGHYAGQIGSEATPAEFVDALLAATAEMVRVLKPSGSIWVNLGDKYASGDGSGNQSSLDGGVPATRANGHARIKRSHGVPTKSLIGIPWRYAIRCIDELGLILRAEVIWSKPNGLPESVTDRVRRSHETWFHFTKMPRYFSAVDEIREAHASPLHRPGNLAGSAKAVGPQDRGGHSQWEEASQARTWGSSLGKLPGSVWTIATQPLTVPDHLGIDHFAAFPMEWPRRIIAGWSPAGVCTACGEGRRPVVSKEYEWLATGSQRAIDYRADVAQPQGSNWSMHDRTARLEATVTGYACACPDPSAPTTPSVILDPFGGTGTTVLVAKVLGRHGISVDMSADYCRLAQWRTNDPNQIASAAQVEKPPRECDGQEAFDFKGTA